MNTIITRILITGALLVATHAFAAGASSEPERTPDKLEAVRAQIAAKNFPGAIDDLKRLNDTGDADWNNLMGYRRLKAPMPDSLGAAKFYAKRSTLDPQHSPRLESSANTIVAMIY